MVTVNSESHLARKQGRCIWFFDRVAPFFHLSLYSADWGQEWDEEELEVAGIFLKKTLRRTLFLFLCNLHNSCSSVREMEPGMLLGCHSQNFLAIFLVKLSDVNSMLVILRKIQCLSLDLFIFFIVFPFSFNSNMLNLIHAIRDSKLISNSPQPLGRLHLKLNCLHFPQRRL